MAKPIGHNQGVPMTQYIVAFALVLISFGAFGQQKSSQDHQVIRHFTDQKNVVLGKVVIQISRPGETKQQLESRLTKKMNEAVSNTYALIASRGHNLVYEIDGRQVKKAPLCAVYIDGPKVTYNGCEDVLFDRT